MISIKKIILLLLVFIQIFWWDNLLGQTKNVFGTTDCPQEKIQLHLSQQSLFPGEIVWFKIYCSSPLDPKEDLSNLAFIELLLFAKLRQKCAQSPWPHPLTSSAGQGLYPHHGIFQMTSVEF